MLPSILAANSMNAHLSSTNETTLVQACHVEDGSFLRLRRINEHFTTMQKPAKNITCQRSGWRFPTKVGAIPKRSSMLSLPSSFVGGSSGAVVFHLVGTNQLRVWISNTVLRSA